MKSETMHASFDSSAKAFQRSLSDSEPDVNSDLRKAPPSQSRCDASHSLFID